MGLAENVDAVLRAGVERGDVPGVAAAVTDRNGLVHETAFGARQLGGEAAMTPDTVFWIASMTKAVTGVAAMQCVERGLLSLDEPASKVLPYLGEVPVLEGFDGDGAPKLRPAKGEITLRRLLTHTAGFGYETWHEPIKRYYKQADLPPRTTGKKITLTTPLLYDPGEEWQYSISIDWAGLMVEEVTGRRLGDFVRENVFEPLGMTSTGYKLSDDMRARRVTLHQRGEDGAFTPVPGFEVVQDPEFEAGGGGLYSTVGDYAAFTRMILNKGTGNGNTLLKPETVEQMSVNQMGDCRVVELKSYDPERSLDAEFFPGVPKTWGLTFMINEEDAPTGRPAGSLAWAGLGNSYYWIDPKNGLAGVYATQILPFVDTKSLPLYLDFETAVYRSL